jgi:hypothetical protein
MSQLKLFRKVTAVYYENQYETHINCWNKNAELLILALMVHISNSGLKS